MSELRLIIAELQLRPDQAVSSLVPQLRSLLEKPRVSIIVAEKVIERRQMYLSVRRSYLIRSDLSEAKVERSFSQLKALRENLSGLFGYLVLPPLPDRDLSSVNAFFRQLLQHSELCFSPLLVDFATASDKDLEETITKASSMLLSSKTGGLATSVATGASAKMNGSFLFRSSINGEEKDLYSSSIAFQEPLVTQINEAYTALQRWLIELEKIWTEAGAIFESLASRVRSGADIISSLALKVRRFEFHYPDKLADTAFANWKKTVYNLSESIDTQKDLLRQLSLSYLAEPVEEYTLAYRKTLSESKSSGLLERDQKRLFSVFLRGYSEIQTVICAKLAALNSELAERTERETIKAKVIAGDCTKRLNRVEVEEEEENLDESICIEEDMLREFGSL